MMEIVNQNRLKQYVKMKVEEIVNANFKDKKPENTILWERLQILEEKVKLLEMLLKGGKK